jgi:hypothetical protein
MVSPMVVSLERKNCRAKIMSGNEPVGAQNRVIFPYQTFLSFKYMNK